MALPSAPNVHDHDHEAPRRTTPPNERRGSGFRLGYIAGVEVWVDLSLLLIFALITYNLGAGLFPEWHPEWAPALSWAVALGAAVAFFASVLVHELSHALMARRYGVPARRITLFLFGGLAHLEREAPSARAELWIAAIGPITSLVIGVVASVAGARLAGEEVAAAAASEDARALATALTHVGPLPTLLLWLGPLNITLALFNMVPGFPLDGGRVLRALLWSITKDATRATRWAARTGQAIALALVLFGALRALSGAFVGGAWLALIGWFLYRAASRAYQSPEAR